jgi:hypothetical protein
MQTPKRGLKSIGDPVYEGSDPFRKYEKGELGDFMWTVLLGPFRTFGGFLNTSNFGKLLQTMIFVFLGSFLNGVVYVFVQANSNAAATDQVLRSFILGIVGASIYYVTSIWSYYDNLPTIIYPAQSFAMIGLAFTRKKEETFGFATACVYAGFQFLGYCMAGLTLRAFGGPLINTTTALYNVAVSDQGYWVYWFGASIIAFSFVFNRLFKQSPGETGGADTASRASTAGALAILIFTVGFYTLGIKSYSSGLFATQVLAYPSLPDTAATVSGAVPWAFYVFVDLLAVPATVIVLVMAIYLVQWLFKLNGKQEEEVESVPQPATFQAAGISSNMSSSARLTQRTKLAVQY